MKIRAKTAGVQSAKIIEKTANNIIVRFSSESLKRIRAYGFKNSNIQLTESEQNSERVAKI